ncbi:hypothetical protein [Pseudomonas segetis]|uniref:Uncharacterized protein n=1 Tax=Pseudomonas segetis TaxID=298908 RepID=A0A239CAC7_9PSED|nr:hypothetical protein [Pseudomonas segetis]SNS16581.1 hypothetical protein SAMN05216255_1572 [Pseudomonas segetis]
MNTSTAQVTPAVAAQYDWMTQGEFWPERFQGEQRKQYEQEQQRIQREWDNKPQ